MKIVDANIILRYFLDDDEELSPKAAEIIEQNNLTIPNEVFAEIVYVLEKVYKIERKEISNTLIEFLYYENVNSYDLELIKTALDLYARRSLDFVDTILYSYKEVKNYEIFTFDKKLSNLLNNKNL